MFSGIGRVCHKKRGTTKHLKTARCDMFKMETEAMKKLEEELKCNGDVESNFGDKEIHSEKEGRNRDNNLEKSWKERPIR